MPGPSTTEGPCSAPEWVAIPQTPPSQILEQACPSQKKLKIRQKEDGILDAETETLDDEVLQSVIEPDIRTGEHEGEIVDAAIQGETPKMCQTE